MKKTVLIILAIMLATMFFGCSGKTAFNDTERGIAHVDNEYVSLEIISNDGACYVCRDVTTDVLYLVVHVGSSSMMTPILNSDGTPKLYVG